MKLAELKLAIHKANDNTNGNKARKIRAKARALSKKNNPGETKDPTGWNADPHAGGHGSSFLGRAVS